MIGVPENIVITRNKASERLLLDKGKEWLEKDERAPGIHASALLDLRQAYWNMKNPQGLGAREVVMFMLGKVLHAFVLGAVEGTVDLNATDEGSHYSDDLRISFSPDKILDGVVRELKTTRSFYEPKDVNDLSFYLEQLLIYMAATKTITSELWILYLNLKDPETKRTVPQFRCFRVTITPDELARVSDDVRQQRFLLQEALDSDSDAELPVCREFKCGALNCPHYANCQPPGRYGDAKWDGTAVPKKQKS